MRTPLILSAFALLAGCGQASETADDVPGSPTDKLLAADDSMTAQCKSLPDFVKLYDGAKLLMCVAGEGVGEHHQSGTVVYLAPAPATQVKIWYKGQAKMLGMADNLDSDTPNPIYSARDGTKRSFMMMTAPEGAGTKVTLNWGRDL